jgi:MFS family permease
VILLAAVFMTTADNSIVNVAVPSINVGLDASGGELEFIVSGYMLAYAVLLVTGARLGGLFGYRRIFLLGVLVFTGASLACGLAPGSVELIVARVIQGIGAALMVPQVLTGIQLGFDGVHRARALALYPAALAGGAAAGQALGGVLITLNVFGTGWRPIFLINVPVGCVLLVVGSRRLPVDEGDSRERLDLAGVAALSTALLLLTVPLMLGRDQGWPLWTWVSLLASAPAFAVFVALERRLDRGGGDPLLRLRLFRSSAVSWALAAQAAATVPYAAMLFVVALYLQHGLGKSPLYSGMAVLAWVAGFGLSGPLLRSLPASLIARAAPIGFALLGFAFLGLAIECLTTVPAGAPLMAVLGLGGLGMGVGFSSLIAQVTNNVAPELASDLSGVVSTNSEVFSALGVAVFGTLYFALANSASALAALGWVAAALGAFGLLGAAAAHQAMGGCPVDGHRPERTEGRSER